MAPEDIAERLRIALEALLEAFPDDEEVEHAVQEAQSEVDDLEQTLTEDWRGGPDDDDFDAWRDLRSPGPPDSGIFTDVDK